MAAPIWSGDEDIWRQLAMDTFELVRLLADVLLSDGDRGSADGLLARGQTQ